MRGRGGTTERCTAATTDLLERRLVVAVPGRHDRLPVTVDPRAHAEVEVGATEQPRAGIRIFVVLQRWDFGRWAHEHQADTVLARHVGHEERVDELVEKGIEGSVKPRRPTLLAGVALHVPPPHAPGGVHDDDDVREQVRLEVGARVPGFSTTSTQLRIELQPGRWRPRRSNTVWARGGRRLGSGSGSGSGSNARRALHRRPRAPSLVVSGGVGGGC